jgi:hypothetical protein
MSSLLMNDYQTHSLTLSITAPGVLSIIITIIIILYQKAIGAPSHTSHMPFPNLEDPVG